MADSQVKDSPKPAWHYRFSVCVSFPIAHEFCCFPSYLGCQGARCATHRRGPFSDNCCRRTRKPTVIVSVSRTVSSASAAGKGWNGTNKTAHWTAWVSCFLVMPAWNGWARAPGNMSAPRFWIFVSFFSRMGVHNNPRHIQVGYGQQTLPGAMRIWLWSCTPMPRWGSA